MGLMFNQVRLQGLRWAGIIVISLDFFFLHDHFPQTHLIFGILLLASCLPFLKELSGLHLKMLYTVPNLFFTIFMILCVLSLSQSLDEARSLKLLLGFSVIYLFSMTTVNELSLPEFWEVVHISLGAQIAMSFLCATFHVLPQSFGHNDPSRFSGLSMNPNPMAWTCALYLLLSLFRAGRIWVARQNLQSFLVSLGFHLVLTPISLVLLVQTKSLGTVLAFLAAVGICLLIRLRGRLNRFPKWHLGYGVLISAVILGIGACALFFYKSLWLQKIKSMGERIDIWVYAINRIQEKPWLGYGIGCNKMLMKGFHDQNALAGSHNLLLDSALWAGIGGALVIVAFFYAILRKITVHYRKDPEYYQVILAVLLFHLLLSMTEPLILTRITVLLIILTISSDLSKKAILVGGKVNARISDQ